ncbi:MAG TPA: hypothetical protein G4O16_05430 [Dehalococcoidia bacterium]|nr:hypothetical protein [Dehalococcoidia bacterium]
MSNLAFIKDIPKIRNIRANSLNVKLLITLECHLCLGDDSGLAEFILLHPQLLNSGSKVIKVEPSGLKGIIQPSQPINHLLNLEVDISNLFFDYGIPGTELFVHDSH